MTIEDVPSPDTCVCRTDEGKILEGLREDMLETLVPKVKGNRVMVVLGPQAGRVSPRPENGGGGMQGMSQGLCWPC